MTGNRHYGRPVQLHYFRFDSFTKIQDIMEWFAFHNHIDKTEGGFSPAAISWNFQMRKEGQ